MADETFDPAPLPQALDAIELRTRDLETAANSFARAMTQAFASSVAGGRQFDDMLKSLALRLSDLALRLAFAPLTQGLAGGLAALLDGLFKGAKPFADGGVINTPAYFPLGSGLGVAGEAGPEAILPLRRGPDGRLGVAAAGGAGTQISIQIVTPDPESFRRSETYLTGQIARAVARGQRSL